MAVVGVYGQATGLVLYHDLLHPMVPALLARLGALGVREIGRQV